MPEGPEVPRRILTSGNLTSTVPVWVRRSPRSIRRLTGRIREENGERPRGTGRDWLCRAVATRTEGAKRFEGRLGRPYGLRWTRGWGMLREWSARGPVAPPRLLSRGKCRTHGVPVVLRMWVGPVALLLVMLRLGLSGETRALSLIHI